MNCAAAIRAVVRAGGAGFAPECGELDFAVLAVDEVFVGFVFGFFDPLDNDEVTREGFDTIEAVTIYRTDKVLRNKLLKTTITHGMPTRKNTRINKLL